MIAGALFAGVFLRWDDTARFHCCKFDLDPNTPELYHYLYSVKMMSLDVSREGQTGQGRPEWT
jgi:hypothetical protein